MAMTRKFLPFLVKLQSNSLSRVPTIIQPIRHVSRLPKFKWFRKKKIIALDLPKTGKKMTSEEWRSKMKEMGMFPINTVWNERPIYVGSTGIILETYLPSEGDGKYSLLPKQAIKSIGDRTMNTAKNVFHAKKLQKYDSDFSSKHFGTQAHDIYVNAHEALARKDFDTLIEFATENAIELMKASTDKMTMKWKLIESLDPPIVVQVRVGEAVTSKNFFGQVTVRFHTKQMLALYDRFGRLFCGSEVLLKDVLEYCVFEKHIVNVYGKWKLHSKIIPDWLTPPHQVYPTRRFYPEKEDEDVEDLKEFLDESHKKSSRPVAEVISEDS